MVKCTECGEKTEKYMEFRQGEICYDCLGTDERQPEIRVYAIPENWFDKHSVVERFSDEDIHDISDEEFIQEAEGMGYVWSLCGFQNELNFEGQPTKDLWGYLHFRFINIEGGK